MTPKISVVMPVYNTAKYLETAIESVRSQTMPDWELLLLDDGSTDGSQAIASKFAALDSRIRNQVFPHRGIVATLNDGQQQCCGEFVARLDADDLAVPSRFAVQLDKLQREPRLAMLCGSYQTIDALGNIWKTQHLPSSEGELRQALKHSNCIAHSSVMFRRRILESFTGPYRSHFPLAEDYDLWLRLTAKVSIGSCPEIVLQYRRDLQSINPDRIVQQTLSTIGAQLADRRRAVGLPDPAQTWLLADRNTMIREGIASQFLNAAIRRALLSEARLSYKHGFKETSTRLLQAASPYRPRDEGIIAQLDYLWRRMRVRLCAQISMSQPNR